MKNNAVRLEKDWVLKKTIRLTQRYGKVSTSRIATHSILLVIILMVPSLEASLEAPPQFEMVKYTAVEYEAVEFEAEDHDTIDYEEFSRYAQAMQGLKFVQNHSISKIVSFFHLIDLGGTTVLH